MNFSSIIGHDRPLAVLKRALAHDALAHAWIFSGDPGVGKRMTAMALAAAVNCLSPGPEGGCGACPSCRKAAAGSHPDVHLLMPEREDPRFLAEATASEARKASDEIKIDQVRQAQDSLALRPFEGRKKVLIVDGAEAMNAFAQNALLKTLEEPPGDCLLVLVTSMPHGLLATIRSRCQELKFPPLRRQVLAGVLQDRRGLGADDAWFLAALSRGSLGRALQMDLDAERAARTQAAALLSNLAGKRLDEILTLAEGIAKDREAFEQVLELGIEGLRDRLVHHLTGDDRLLVSPGSLQGAAAPLTSLLRDIDLFTLSRGLIEARVNTQLAAENLFLKLGRT